MATRVAIVSDSVYPYHAGGKEMRLHHLSLGLIRAGFEVVVYTMKWWDGPDRIERDGVVMQAICARYPLYRGERRSIRQALLFGLACLKLARYRFDVIEADQMPFFPLLGARLAAWLRRRPLVVTWHEVWGLTYWRTYLGWLGFIGYAVECIAAKAADRIIAVSPLTADRLTAVLRYHGSIEIIPNGIDVAALANTSIDDLAAPSCDLLYAGRLIEHKGVDVVLRAYALMRTGQPDLRLRVIGDGPDARRLHCVAVELGLDPSAIFAGRLASETEVYASMRRAKVFMTASTREGFGIAALEAMACGVPVVMTDHPDNAARLIVGDGGLAVPATPAAFAEAARRLLDGYPVRPLAAARAYDWSVAENAIISLYAAIGTAGKVPRHAV